MAGTLTINAVKKAGGIHLSSDMAELKSRYIESLRDGTLLEIMFKIWKSPKTNQQVKTIFGLMIATTVEQANSLGLDTSSFIKHLLNEIPNGVGLDAGFLHELMYKVCPTVDEEGNTVTLSKMTTQQANSLFERFRNIVAPLGIVIPDPDPNWRINKEIANGQQMMFANET